MIPIDCTPSFPRGVRLKDDRVRNRWVLLAPERVMEMNPVAVAVLQQVNGKDSLRDIVKILAQKFDADSALIQKDVGDLLESLAQKKMVNL